VWITKVILFVNCALQRVSPIILDILVTKNILKVDYQPTCGGLFKLAIKIAKCKV